MELKTGIEPVTSPLPRECSTTEPRERIKSGEKWSGRRDSNARHPAWKAGTLPTELRPQYFGGGRWIRTIEGKSRQIYSLMPLAARQSRHY